MWDWYKPIAKNIVVPLYAWRDGSKYSRYLTVFERTQYLASDDIIFRQWEEIKRIVRHAYLNCPYYKKKYSESDFHPDDLKSQVDFQRIPVLEKSEIQDHAPEMVAGNVPKDRIEENFTGGSSGSPLRLFLDKDRRDSRTAGMIRHNRWAGLNIGDKLACLWGAPRDAPTGNLKARLRNLLAERLLYLDTSKVTHETMSEFIRSLSHYKPRHYLGYANSIVLFARYLKEKNLVGLIRPRSIISSAEVLTSEDRGLVESVFQCKVFDRYGCREASVLASECEAHNGMHMNAESVYLEFVRGYSHVGTGELGEILLTDLRNLAMPLIRYRIGDAGIPTDGTCSCGRGLPMMQMAAGRVTDFIVTSDRKLVSGVVLSTYLITKIDGLKQVQFYQDRPGQVMAKIVASDRFTNSHNQTLRRLIADFLGEEMQVDFESVDAIPKEKSGKFRFTISTLDPLEYVI